MRGIFAAAASAVLLSSAGAALAAPVSVTIGPELASKADRFGQRDVERLSEELAKNVSAALDKSGAQRADLVLESAVPNRPTFEQMRRNNGLSMWSRGVGGASVTGAVTLADGTVQPVSYRWFETNLWWGRPAITTWDDAERTFDALARKISAGKIPNEGPHRAGARDQGMFGYRY